MSNPQTQPTPADKLCEATHCGNEATTELSIPIGEIGNVHIYVCDTCIKKFGTFSSKAASKEFKKK